MVAVSLRSPGHAGENEMREFISEGDLETFEGWLSYQGIDAATLTRCAIGLSRAKTDIFQ
jgi:hypothetical protein